MKTIRRITMQITQIHINGMAEQCLSMRVITQLGGQNALHHRRQRRVARRQRIVVVKIRPLQLLTELRPTQEESQHHIRLLNNLIAVNRQRMIVQQQRPLRLSPILIPNFPLQEVRVLRVNTTLPIKGNTHRVGSRAPLSRFLRPQIQAMHHLLEIALLHLPQALHPLGGHPHVVAGHHVGKEVIVHHRGVLVGTRHPMNMELTVHPKESQILPQARCLHQNVDGLPEEEIRIATGTRVLHCGIRDISINVVLSRARRIVGTGLFPIDSAPRIQGTALIQLGRPVPRLRQHLIAEPQCIPCHLRHGVGKEGHHINFGVPEVMSRITRTRHALRRNTQVLRTRR